MRNNLACALAWLAACSGAIAQEQQRAPAGVEQILQTQESIFGPLHAATINIPAGEKVGDIIDTSREVPILIARVEDCFPSLKPRQAKTQLPALTIQSEKGLAAALGAGPAEATGESQGGQTFLLEYSDAQVERVSIYQLRRALKKTAQECDLVRPYLDAAYSSLASNKRNTSERVHIAEADSTIGRPKPIVTANPPILLIGTLFYARRVIHVRTVESLVGNAKLSYIERLLNRLNIASAFRVSVEGGQRYTNIVDLIGSDSVPIALIPAFIITEQRKVGDNFVFKVAAVKQDVVQTKMRIARNIGKASFAKLLADANQLAPPPMSTASYANLFRHYSRSRPFLNTDLHLNTKTFKFEPVPKRGPMAAADVVNRTSRGNVLHRALIGVGF